MEFWASKNVKVTAFESFDGNFLSAIHKHHEYRSFLNVRIIMASHLGHVHIPLLYSHYRYYLTWTSVHGKIYLSSTNLFPVRVLKDLFFSRSIRGGNIVLHDFLNFSPFWKLLNFFQRICKLWKFFIFHDFTSVLYIF